MEAGPFGRALQFGDIPGPHFVGPDRQELGLGVERMNSLTAALASLMLGCQEPIHGTDRAVIAAFIEQRRSISIDLDRPDQPATHAHGEPTVASSIIRADSP